MTEDTNLLMDLLEYDKAVGGGEAAGSDTHEPESGAPTPLPNEQEGTEPTLRLTFLGKEMAVPLSEAARWAQKGMNAEHALQKYQNAPEQELIRFYAALFDMSRGEFLEALERDKLKVETELELGRLRESNPDMPEHLLLHAARLGAERRLQELEAARQTELSMEQTQPWQALAARFPEFRSAEDLPEEALLQIDQGISPLEAMLGYELDKAQAKIERLTTLLQAVEQNEETRQRTTGSAQTFGGEAAKDPFLLGISLGR